MRECEGCGVDDELKDADIGHQMLNIDKDLLLAVNYIDNGLCNLVQDFLEVIIAETGGVAILSSNEAVEQLGHSI